MSLTREVRSITYICIIGKDKYTENRLVTEPIRHSTLPVTLLGGRECPEEVNLIADCVIRRYVFKVK